MHCHSMARKKALQIPTKAPAAAEKSSHLKRPDLTQRTKDFEGPEKKVIRRCDNGDLFVRLSGWFDPRPAAPFEPDDFG
jgi:hypothetical protein